MRIELPATSWASAHRAQDDAHTLTVAPEHEARGPLAALLQAAGETPLPPMGVSSVAGLPPAVLTLTF